MQRRHPCTAMLLLFFLPAMAMAAAIKPVAQERCPDEAVPPDFDPASLPYMEKYLKDAPRLLYALGRDRHPLLKRLLDAGDNPNVCVKGSSLLAISAVSGDAEEIRLLLDGGAHPDKPMDAMGTTPLMFALSMAKFDAARQLLQRGASLKRVSDSGMTVLHELAMAPVKDDPADKARQLQLAQEMLAAGVPVDAQATQGATALMLAVAARNRELAALLLDHGARPDKANRRGQTPIGTARKIGDAEILGLLEAALAKRSQP